MCELFNNINLIEDEIVEITELGYEDTIDIETDGNHLFFANNLLTHNSSVEEVEFDHSHISGGLSKIQTADNVIGIFTSRAMRERGRYQIQLMKTRSSSGVGAKVDLEFDVDSLRIRDLADDDNSSYSNQPSPMYNNLKRTTEISSENTSTEVREDPSEGNTVGKIRAQTDSTKLREFLNNLPGDEE